MDARRFAKLLGFSEESQSAADELLKPSKSLMETYGVEDQGSDEANKLAIAQKSLDMMGGVAGSIKNVGQKALTAAEALAQAPAKEFGKTIVRDLGEQNFGKVKNIAEPVSERFGSIRQKLTPQEAAAEKKLMELREAQKAAKAGKNDPDMQALEKVKEDYLKGTPDLALESFLAKRGIK